MSEHADRALQLVSGSYTDPAHRLAAAQVHATLAVAEAISARPVVIDTLTEAHSDHE